ncbi:MAG: alpha/beta hydrolase [Gammaproteobacteria bacterium]|nr:alpha/beta hydrolase [Gammaproteobacteria bacterium]
MNKNLFNRASFLFLLIVLFTSCGPKKQTLDKPEVAPIDPYAKASRLELSSSTQSYVKLVELGTHNLQTMLLIHGLGNNASKDWYKLVPELSKRYHVLLLDLPGFGGSEYNNQHFYTPEYYAKLIDEVASKHLNHKSKPIVVGHSLGGAVAIKYTAEYQDEVSKLVLLDVAGILQESVFARYIANFKQNNQSKSVFKKLADSVKRKVNMLTNRFIRSSDAWLNVEEIISSDTKREYLFEIRPDLNAGIGLVSENFSEEIRAIKVPTLIIWGNQDPVAPLRTAKILNKHIESSELMTIKNSGHSPMLDSPKKVITIITNWINSDATSTLQSPELVFKGNAECDNQDNKVYSGQYNIIKISNCDKVTLRNVAANKIIIDHSIVKVENSTVTQGIAAYDSKLAMTNVKATGEIGFESISNQLDVAASDFDGLEAAIKFNGVNTVYWSVSSYKSRDEQINYLHGREIYKTVTQL